MATPYVISSDLVSAYPAKSLEIAQYIDGFKSDLALVQNAQTGTTYTLAAADFTKLVTLSNASPVAVTLPLEATVPWPAGTTLRLLNQGAGLVTVAGAVGVTINGTPLTLGQYKGANLIKTGTNTWTFIPFASGVGAAVYSDANTGTYTGFAYKTFTSSGTLTVTTAGFADIVVCGGGGGASGGNGGAGGAGGVLQVTNAYLPVGTLTITVGAGGAGGVNAGQSGSTTRLSDYYSPGGGGGAAGGDAGGNGGSGGGGKNGGAGGGGISPIGNNGGLGVASGAFGSGGGGGAGAVGAPGTTGGGGNGGAGVNVTLAGTTPTGAYVAGNYALGGGGGGGTSSGGTAGTASDGGGAGSPSANPATNGTANTGGGAGGGFPANSNPGANGGSGIVIVRVAV
jgi:hypothetical protein